MLCYWPIDSPPSFPGLHDLRIACLNTYYNMKAISINYNITEQVLDNVMVIAIYIGMIDMWIEYMARQSCQDAILGGLSIGQLTFHLI